MDTFWVCPFCNTVNVDDVQQTALPMCSECSEHTTWADIYTTCMVSPLNKDDKSLAGAQGGDPALSELARCVDEYLAAFKAKE